MKISTRYLIAPIVFGSFLALSACNTMRGIGEDTEKAGEKIQEEADEHDAP